VKTYWFLFWAYSVIWGFIAGFLLLLLVKQTKSERKLETIERRIEGGPNR
jgi:CcmD family protein